MTIDELKNTDVTLKINTTAKLGEILPDDIIEDLYTQMGSDNKENEEFLENALGDEYMYNILDDAIIDNLDIKCRIS